MPVRIIFRCEFCDARPDPLTQLSLERQLRELGFGLYLDAPPGRWLVWMGGGPLGPRRYACADHRGELTADLREHYGTIAPNPWRRPPYPTTVRSADTDRAIATADWRPAPTWASDDCGPQMTGAPIDPLTVPVYAAGAYKPFGEFTLAEVRARAEELSAAVGWGPTARVASVARGWSELARRMQGEAAVRVADLGAEAGGEFARKLWVVPPGGSLL